VRGAKVLRGLENQEAFLTPLPQVFHPHGCSINAAPKKGAIP
jgi:hypothetical protein